MAFLGIKIKPFRLLGKVLKGALPSVIAAYPELAILQKKVKELLRLLALVREELALSRESLSMAHEANMMLNGQVVDLLYSQADFQDALYSQQRDTEALDDLLGVVGDDISRGSSLTALRKITDYRADPVSREVRPPATGGEVATPKGFSDEN